MLLVRVEPSFEGPVLITDVPPFPGGEAAVTIRRDWASSYETNYISMPRALLLQGRGVFPPSMM